MGLGAQFTEEPPYSFLALVFLAFSTLYFGNALTHVPAYSLAFARIKLPNFCAAPIKNRRDIGAINVCVLHCFNGLYIFFLNFCELPYGVFFSFSYNRDEELCRQLRWLCHASLLYTHS